MDCWQKSSTTTEVLAATLDKLVSEFKDEASSFFLPEIDSYETDKNYYRLKRNALTQLQDILHGEPSSIKSEYERLLKKKIQIQYEELQRIQDEQQYEACKVKAEQQWYKDVAGDYANKPVSDLSLSERDLRFLHEQSTPNIISLAGLPLSVSSSSDNNGSRNYRQLLESFLDRKLEILLIDLELKKGEFVNQMVEFYMVRLGRQLRRFNTTVELEHEFEIFKVAAAMKFHARFGHVAPCPEFNQLKAKCFKVIKAKYEKDLIVVKEQRQHKSQLKHDFLRRYGAILESEKYIVEILSEDPSLDEMIVKEIKTNFLQDNGTYVLACKDDLEFLELMYQEGRRLLSDFRARGVKKEEFYGHVKDVKCLCFEEYMKKLLDKVTNENITVIDLETFYGRLLEEMEQDFIEKAIQHLPKSNALVALLQPYVQDLQETLHTKYKETVVRVEQGELHLLVKMRQSSDWYEAQMTELMKVQPFLKPLDFYQKHVEFADQSLARFGTDLTPIQQSALRDNFHFLFDKYNDINNENAPCDDPAIGIDLGTTYSCAAIYVNGEVKVIPSEYYRSTVPSYLSFNTATEEILVGEIAKEKAHENPTATIFNTKLLIGRKFNEVKELIQDLPFNVVEKDGNPMVNIDGKLICPEFIAAQILSHMKALSERFCQGKPIKKAVITVPANFKDGQRQATLDAGKIAGLEVLRIINEPTAAALAYNLQHCKKLLEAIRQEDKLNVVVYDLGGGTFDVSVLTIDKFGSIEVKAVAGCNLGGEAFDQAMVDFCVQKFKDQFGINLAPVDLRQLPASGYDYGGTSQNIKKPSEFSGRRARALHLLRNACEKKKRDLSACSEVQISIGSLFQGQDLNVKITRAEFEAMNMRHLEKTIDIVKLALQEASLAPADIHEVVMVGGSTRIPKIRSMVSELFNGKQLLTSLNPDELVAIGAAQLAAKLNGVQIQRAQLNFKDVTPFSLGVELKNGTFSKIVQRNSIIPCKNSKEYYTSYDNQKEVRIAIYQGENVSVAKENVLLGEFVLENIPPRPKGKVPITVTMEIDEQGILHVEACEGVSDQMKKITIDERKGRLSTDEIEDLRRQLQCQRLD